jgi:acyl dehydratase
MSTDAPARMRLVDLPSFVGTSLGPGPWIDVTQERIDALAAAVGDTQWIHVNRERAARGPYGATIAHGVLTLGLVFRSWYDTVRVEDAALTINYGFDRVRFPAAVPAGGRIRTVFRVDGVAAQGAGTRAEVNATVELEGEARPACVAGLVLLFVPA